MKRRKTNVKTFIPYGVLIVFLVLLSVAARAFLEQFPHIGEEVDFQLFLLGAVIFIGYYINRIAPKTVIPSFVWAIFAGMALQPLLSFFTHNVSSLQIIMEIAAALILFAGGLEIPFKRFRKWFFPIASLSLIGLVSTAVIFAFALAGIVSLFGDFPIMLIPSIIVLSAALASSDPTAIIPTLKTVHLKKPSLKQIAIAESALTDVTGSVLTRFLLLALITVDMTGERSIIAYFVPLLKKTTYDALALQIISGILIGCLGYWLIKKFYIGTKKKKETGTDPALLMTIPLFMLVLGNLLGGAGLLAAFVAGLMSDVAGGLRRASHIFDNLLNHLVKPFIFIVLGALVPVQTLVLLAPIGIIAALVFMLIIRPFVVFVSLLPWLQRDVFGLKDLLFLSFVRETGIIAAIMLILAAASPVIQSDFVIAIGMWVILLTLIIEPPLTPYFAKKIGIADEAKK